MLFFFNSLFRSYGPPSLPGELDPVEVPQLPPLPLEVWERIGSFVKDNSDLVALGRVNKAMKELLLQQLQIVEQINRHVVRPLLADCSSQEIYNRVFNDPQNTHFHLIEQAWRTHLIYRDHENGLRLLLRPWPVHGSYVSTAPALPEELIVGELAEQDVYLLRAHLPLPFWNMYHRIVLSNRYAHVCVGSVALALRDRPIHPREKAVLESATADINAKLAKLKNENRGRVMKS